MHNIITQEKIQEVAAKIAEKFKPEKIILFGSWAWGQPGPDSDVDLFIIKKTNDTRQLEREIDDFAFPRLFPLDLIVYNPEKVKTRIRAGDFFIGDITRRGKILYDK